eukprot:scaffold6519_cov156-Ochromonas_danica.AAC.9
MGIVPALLHHCSNDSRGLSWSSKPAVGQVGSRHGAHSETRSSQTAVQLHLSRGRQGRRQALSEQDQHSERICGEAQQLAAVFQGRHGDGDGLDNRPDSKPSHSRLVGHEDIQHLLIGSFFFLLHREEPAQRESPHLRLDLHRRSQQLAEASAGHQHNLLEKLALSRGEEEEEEEEELCSHMSTTQIWPSAADAIAVSGRVAEGTHLLHLLHLLTQRVGDHTITAQLNPTVISNGRAKNCFVALVDWPSIHTVAGGGGGGGQRSGFKPSQAQYRAFPGQFIALAGEEGTELEQHDGAVAEQRCGPKPRQPAMRRHAQPHLAEALQPLSGAKEVTALVRLSSRRVQRLHPGLLVESGRLEARQEEVEGMRRDHRYAALLTHRYAVRGGGLVEDHFLLPIFAQKGPRRLHFDLIT